MNFPTTEVFRVECRMKCGHVFIVSAPQGTSSAAMVETATNMMFTHFVVEHPYDVAPRGTETAA